MTLSNRDIPVVLVVAGKKIDYIKIVIQNLSKNCDFHCFFIICPAKDIIKAKLNTSGLTQKIVIVDEDLIVPGLTLSNVKKSLKLSLKNWPENHLAGWYFQQFLKMGFAQYFPNNKYYLLWDADTLLTRKISFFDDDKILFTQGNEYHKEYFQTFSNLFEEITKQSISHISQHLMVQTEDMLSLIQHLDSPKTTWWMNILSSLNGNTPFQFSEYETYANFCLFMKSNSYRSTKRRWLRYGRSYFGCDLTQADTSTLAQFYDFVAFEDWDVGILRTLRSYFLVSQRVGRFYVDKFIYILK
jgi:hypothetical protein